MLPNSLSDLDLSPLILFAELLSLLLNSLQNVQTQVEQLLALPLLVLLSISAVTELKFQILISHLLLYRLDYPLLLVLMLTPMLLEPQTHTFSLLEIQN